MFLHHEEGTSFDTVFEGNCTFFPCCPPWTHDLIHVSDKTFFFTYHQSPFSVSHHVLVFLSDRVRRVALRRLVSLCIFPSLPLCPYSPLCTTSPSTSLRLFSGKRVKPIRGETAREIAPFLDKVAHSSHLVKIRTKPQNPIRIFTVHYIPLNRVSSKNNHSSFFSIAESTNGGTSKFNHILRVL